jgi:hypothetical protein
VHSIRNSVRVLFFIFIVLFFMILVLFFIFLFLFLILLIIFFVLFIDLHEGGILLPKVLVIELTGFLVYFSILVK